MNKNELVTAISARSGLTKKDAEAAVNVILDTIAESLKKGEKVQLTGFGVFEAKEREARIGRNPHTKEAIQIPATRIPAFKPSKTLKDKVAK